MDFKKLSQLDIKDLQKIDYNQLSKDISKKPDILICAILVIVTLISSFKIFAKHRSELKSLRYEVALLEKKNDAIEKYQTTKTEMNTFIEKLPSDITEEELINFITDISLTRGIKLESFPPARTQQYGLYDLITVDLTFSVNKYADLWLFINDIEKSQDAIRIGKLSTTVSSSDGRGIRRHRAEQADSRKKTPESAIHATLTIGAIHIKYDNKDI
ncbi:MAG: type 4a pilus biogenesis protein PilO [Candidatus Omnitrophica bacterium]|nr:type 4a pilus biogenesis protein PilO [Candidatus Omnitrophota bacterium]